MMTEEELDALDKKVAEALGWKLASYLGTFSPSRNWAHAGPIMEMMPYPVLAQTFAMKEIGLESSWRLWLGNEDGEEVGDTYGETPPIAICKAFVAWKQDD